jgi:hypothetical protein
VKDILAWSVAAGVLAAILGGLAWLASRARRRGVGREIMGPVDLIYRPHTHQINLETRMREERVLPVPPADDQHR